MSLDPNIALSVRPMQLPDFNALAQQRLAGTENIMAMQQQQRQLSDQNNLRQIYSTSVNPQTGEVDSQKLLTGLARAGRGDLIPQVQATLADAQQKKAGADKATLELHLEKTDRAIADIARVSNPVQAVGLVKKYQEAGDLDPEKAADYIQRITADPKNWQKLQEQIMTDALSVKDQLGQRLEQAKFGYQQQNDAANRGVTMRGQDISASTAIRGQNLNHQEAVARLGAETASGDPLSKDALDLVANVYLQTGSMPPLGMGKAAAATRAAVLTRAAQLGGGGGADAVGNIVGNMVGLAGKKASARAVGNIGGKVDYGVNELQSSIPLAAQASAALPRGSFVPATKVSQLIASGNSDPRLKDFAVKTQAVINAYNLVAGRAGTGIEERKHNSDLLRTADSPQAYKAALDAMNLEGTIAKGASSKTMDDITGTHAGGTLTKQGNVLVWKPH